MSEPSSRASAEPGPAPVAAAVAAAVPAPVPFTASSRGAAVLAGLLLALGLVWSLLTPLFDGPDEVAHFLRAHALAEGQLVLQDHDTEVLRFIQGACSFEPDSRFQRELRRVLAEAGERVPNLAWAISLYPPLPYLHDGLVVALVLAVYGGDEQAGGRGVGAGPEAAGGLGAEAGDDALLAAAWACRLLTLLITVGLWWVAFRVAPAAAPALFWVAATPMAASLSGVIGIDSLVLAAAGLLLALALGDGTQRRFRFWSAVAIALLVLGKAPYALLLVPAFALSFVATPELARRRRRVLIVAGVLAVLAAAAWNRTALHEYERFKEQDLAARFAHQQSFDPQQQVDWLLEQPGRLVSVPASTLDRFGTKLARQLVGVFGRRLEVYPPIWTVWVWLCGALLAAWLAASRCRAEVGVEDRFAGNPTRWSGRSRAALGLVAAVTAVFAAYTVNLTAYITQMGVGTGLVDFHQGRHFLPLVLPALLALGWWAPGRRRGPPSISDWSVLVSAALALNVVAWVSLSAP